MLGYQKLFDTHQNGGNPPGDGQEKKDNNGSGSKFEYVSGLIEIPDEMYNINEKYKPNNSGLSNYTGDQLSYEGHLEWSKNNCWVLSNLYLFFRPELASTYEDYASKPIKDIIHDLDNRGENTYRHIGYIFCNGHQDFLDDLKQSIKNSNFDNIFKYINSCSLGINEEKKEIWNRIPDKNKADMMISFYNYQTIYRFHYALSIKNRCRIYTKMLKNPNKMVNIYEMDDLCKEGDIIPSWWFYGKGIYTKISKILGQKCRKVYFGSFNFTSASEYTNAYTNWTNGSLPYDRDGIDYRLQRDAYFDFKPESAEQVWDFGACGVMYESISRDMNDNVVERTNLVENIKISQEADPTSVDFNLEDGEPRETAIRNFLKHGIKDNSDGSKSYVISIRIQKDTHTQIIKLKYDDNLKCTHLIDKQCYQNNDKVVPVPYEYRDNLFEFIFKHMKDIGCEELGNVNFIKESDLRNNLKYYKYHKL